MDLILDGPNRQSPIASVQHTRSTLAGHSAVPRGTHTAPTNANRAMRIAAQRTQGLREPISVFLGEIWQPALRIAAITLASDSAITIARFRPSKDLILVALLTPHLPFPPFAGLFWLPALQIADAPSVPRPAPYSKPRESNMLLGALGLHQHFPKNLLVHLDGGNGAFVIGF